MRTGVAWINEQVAESSRFVPELKAEVARVIVGQGRLIDRLLVTLLADGHALLEGVPGLAKTLAVKTLAAALKVSFRRIQFTPDLLPSDLLGTQIYNPRDGTFSVRLGPIFAHVILADEINRAPAKVQSALLEAMQERQVTIGGETHPLPEPFLVLATQNPIEQEGTYPLPEAQVDRFLLKIRVTYPSRDEERRILDAEARTQRRHEVRAVVDATTILEARKVVDEVYVDEKIREYVLDIVQATRDPAAFGLDLGPYIRYGASPRATIALTLAARAHAYLDRRGYVTPQDIKEMAPDVLRHRILPTYEAEAEGITTDDLIARILGALPVP
jgi:MoxR-like ATPase